MPRKRTDNRERLLEQGLALFSKNGFEATGVQEITQSAGVPKGSFYNHFSSKEDFGLEVVEIYREQACAHLDGMLGSDSGRPIEQIRLFFQAIRDDLAESGFAGGCLAGRLTQELAGEYEAFRSPLDGVMNCMQSYLARCLREAQGLGELDADDNVDELAEFLHNSWQGALLRAKAAHSDRPMKIFMERTFGKLLAVPEVS